jgi:hypothetical protein
LNWSEIALRFEPPQKARIAVIGRSGWATELSAREVRVESCHLIRYMGRERHPIDIETQLASGEAPLYVTILQKPPRLNYRGIFFRRPTDQVPKLPLDRSTVVKVVLQRRSFTSRISRQAESQADGNINHD